MRPIATEELSGRTPPGVSFRGEAAMRPAGTEELEALLRGLPGRPPIPGVDLASVLGAAFRCRFVSLPHDDKVRVDGEYLDIDPGYPSILPQSGFSEAEQRALLTLYVLHEVVHLVQGIGDKRVVEALRAANREVALLHLDLGADFLAAAIAAEAGWDFLWLRELQGRGLRCFPVGSQHGAAARARKAARVVDTRADWILRAAGRVNDRSAYAFVEAGGAHFLVLRSGVPGGVIHAGPLSADEGAILGGAADDGSALERVDEVLRGLLGARFGCGSTSTADRTTGGRSVLKPPSVMARASHSRRRAQ